MAINPSMQNHRSDAGAGRRGQYGNCRHAREGILTPATDVFSRSGPPSGSLRELARLAQMSEAGVLSHYASRNALLLATLERRDAWQTSRLDELSSDPRTLSHRATSVTAEAITDIGMTHRRAPTCCARFRLLPPTAHVSARCPSENLETH
ncbi:TetR family transcriptional regulator [Agromyces bracchium]|uniref:TetR family transcriptional regulator n=1 Tax=Agromyces bracchium TaxID=88376 RepID=A0A6I3MB23_9MICO|nr:TetR family transcriptional regulator [Agromyces bracchium]